MDKSQILEKVTEIIIDNLGASESEATPTADIRDDLGADSLDCVEIVIDIEDEFCIVLPEETHEKLKTINDVVEYVASKVS